MTVFIALVVDFGYGICRAGFAGIAPCAVFLPVVAWPQMLGIMASMHQKDSYALFGPGKWHVHLALCSSRGFQAQMPCRQARRQVFIMAGLDQRDSFFGVKVVVIIPVVVQRLISMVLLTMVIPQLQILDKVIDVPGMEVVQVLPSRFARCVQRQVQFINKVVYTPVEMPRHSHGPDCLSDQRGSQLLDTVVDALFCRLSRFQVIYIPGRRGLLPWSGLFV